MANSDDPLSNTRLNWLRAAVLGANDGIVSVASIALGVAGATSHRGTIITAGIAGLAAGALSMAVGEYVSVSSQRDSERSYINQEKIRLKEDPEHELAGLARAYESKGLSAQTAQLVAKELSKDDALKAHLEAELNLDEEDLNNPWHAAIASLLSFTVGGVIPLLAILIVRQNLRVTITFIAVLAALSITGYLSAVVGDASRRRAVIRVVIGGALAMAATFAIGHLFKTTVG